MSKLFKLKEWLTVADAARHLSIAFGEDVTEADVLRLALDGRLHLSVYFVNHATARCGNVVGLEEVEWRLFPCPPGRGGLPQSADESSVAPRLRAPAKLLALLKDVPTAEWPNLLPIPSGLNIDEDRFLELSDGVTTLRGVWDLPMIGNERLDIEHEYQNFTGGPAVTLQGLDGAFVEGRDGQICQLQENFDENEYQTGSSAHLERLKQHIAENSIKGADAESLLNRHKEQRKEFLERQRARPAKDNHYPAGGLPKDAVIVVRTKALREFEQSLNDEIIIKQLAEAKDRIADLELALAGAEKANVPGERSEKTYLNIIGGLLALMLGKSPAGKPQSSFEGQEAIISSMLGHYGQIKGMGDSNLQKIMAKANKTLKDSTIGG